MTHARMLRMSERWFWILERLYPPDFRDEMGRAMFIAYMDRAREKLKTGGKIHLVALWSRALVDSLRNGPAERARPAAAWRRAGNWGRDIELVRRRLVRFRMFAATTIGTLTIGLGMFAVAYTAVQKVLLDPMPYTDPGDLYDVWRDYGSISDLKRGALGGTDITELQKRMTLSKMLRDYRRSWAGFSRYGKAPIPWKSLSRGHHRTCSICSVLRPPWAAALRRTRSAQGAGK